MNLYINPQNPISSLYEYIFIHTYIHTYTHTHTHTHIYIYNKYMTLYILESSLILISLFTNTLLNQSVK